MARFCPICGKEETSNQPLLNGFCQNCFIKETPFFKLPKEIQIEICRNCGSHKHHGKWLTPQTKTPRSILQQAISKTVKENIKISQNARNINIEITPKIPSVKPYGSKKFKVEIFGSGFLHPNQTQPHQEHKFQTVNVQFTTCPRCSKLAAKYYEAILQVRREERNLTKKEIGEIGKIAKNEAWAKLATDRMAFISDIVRRKGGVDFYLGSLSVARSIASKIRDRFGGEMSESPTLYGKDQTGKELYRVAISLRLPEFRLNDFVQYRDRVLLVEDLNSQVLTGRDMSTGEIVSVNWRAVSEAGSQRIAKKSDLQRTVVTVVMPEKIQVLDPDTYKPIDLPNPPHLDLHSGQEVYVLKHNGKSYVVRSVN